MASDLRKSTVVSLTKIVRSVLPRTRINAPATLSTQISESIVHAIENDPFLHGNIKLLRQNGRILADVGEDSSSVSDWRDGWFVVWDGVRNDIFADVSIGLEPGVLDSDDDYGDPENPDLDEDYYETEEAAYRALVVAVNRNLLEELDILVDKLDNIAKTQGIPYKLKHVNVLLQQDPKVW